MPREREKGLSTQLPTLPLEPVQLEPARITHLLKNLNEKPLAHAMVRVKKVLGSRCTSAGETERCIDEALPLDPEEKNCESSLPPSGMLILGECRHS